MIITGFVDPLVPQRSNVAKDLFKNDELYCGLNMIISIRKNLFFLGGSADGGRDGVDNEET